MRVRNGCGAVAGSSDAVHQGTSNRHIVACRIEHEPAVRTAPAPSLTTWIPLLWPAEVLDPHSRMFVCSSGFVEHAVLSPQSPTRWVVRSTHDGLSAWRLWLLLPTRPAGNLLQPRHAATSARPLGPVPPSRRDFSRSPCGGITMQATQPKMARIHDTLLDSIAVRSRERRVAPAE